MSRWAPASEPPTTASRVAPHLGARLPVRRRARRRPGRRARCAARRRPRCRAARRTARRRAPRRRRRRCGPRTRRRLGREGLDDDRAAPSRARLASTPASVRVGAVVEAARAPRDRRAPAAARRPAGAIISRQPGQPVEDEPGQERQPDAHDCGIVSATTRRPRSAPRRPSRELVLVAAGFRAETPSTFQLSGPVGRERHVGHEVDLVVGEAR